MSQFALRKNHSYPVAFRAKIGRRASELCKEKPDSYLASIATEFFGLQQREWDTLVTDAEKEVYRAQRAEIEKAKNAIRRAKKDWEDGKPQRHQQASISKKRIAGAGPPPSLATIEEALTRYFVYVTQELQSTCPRSLVRVKAGQLVTAARDQNVLEVGCAFREDGAIRMEWLERFASRWMERNFLTARPLGEKKQDLVSAR